MEGFVEWRAAIKAERFLCIDFWEIDIAALGLHGEIVNFQLILNFISVFRRELRLLRDIEAATLIIEIEDITSLPN